MAIPTPIRLLPRIHSEFAQGRLSGAGGVVPRFVGLSGAILQRTNKVTLAPQGAACELQVVSNFSGWEHSHRGDFKKRVEESLVKLKAATTSQPAESAPPIK
jgi:hypothetical protein